MTPEQLKTHFGVRTQKGLAEILGKPHSTVAEWFQRGVVPLVVQYELQIRTNGKLQAKPR